MILLYSVIYLLKIVVTNVLLIKQFVFFLLHGFYITFIPTTAHNAINYKSGYNIIKLSDLLLVNDTLTKY